MKKRFFILLAVCLLLACCAAFGASGESGDNPVHLMDNTTLETVNIDGLTVPLPSGEGWQSAEVSGYAHYLEKLDGGYLFQYKVSAPHQYASAYDESTVTNYFQSQMWQAMSLSGVADIPSGKDGYPVLCYCVPNYMETRGSGIRGIVMYIRGSMQWNIEYGIYPESLFRSVAALSPELSDLSALSSALFYDEAASDVGLSVTVKDSPTRLTAGRQLQCKAVFFNTDLVNAKNKNQDIEWSVYDTDGNAVQGISISKTGVLSTDRKQETNLDIIVQVRSVSFKTRAYYPLTIIPIVSAISVEPTELTFYLGSTDPITVQAFLTPDCVPTDVLTWKSAAPKIADVTDLGNGQATIQPVSIGKTNINVGETGGRKATVKVSVAQEVTDLELVYSGKPRPGSSVSFKANILPKNATDKNVVWSLDVDDSIATIYKNGQLKIAKTAPVGSVITVTCTAAGAPEPVIRTQTVTVEE